MTQFLYANNAATTLAGPIAATATVVNLAAGTGTLFPNPGVGQQFALTFVSAGNPNTIEIVYCTGRSSDACTIVRGQEGTPATAFIAGDLASNDLTAGTCAAFIQVAQQQIDAPNYAVDIGSVNAIQVTLNPQPGSLALIAGAPIRVLVGHTNTNNTTLTITGLPTTTVFAQNGATNSLAAGSLIVGQIYEFVYVPSVGFEVSTAKVLLSLANTWAASQTLANSAFWSGNNTGGASQPLLGVDGANSTAMFAGPTGASAWYVGNNARSALLMYLSSVGLLHTAGGITTAFGSTGSGDSSRVPTLADFAGAGISNAWTINLPSLGLTNNTANTLIVQGGIVSVPANDTITVFNLPQTFPTDFLGIVISYGAVTPPVAPFQGSIGAQPLNLSQFQATNTSVASGVSNGCFFIAVGY